MKKSLVLSIIILTAGLLSCGQDNQLGNESSHWRGEGRSGIFHEAGLLQEWSENGPELLWYFDGLGYGFSSPAIANGRIYITGMLNDDDLYLFVFNLAGRLLHQRHIGNELAASNYPGTRSTITVSDGKLYIFNALGHLYCLDEATLDVVWRRDLFNDFDGRQLRHGITETPLIVGDKIFMTPGGIVNNIIALNKNTGELIWSSSGRGTLSGYNSPQFIDGHAVPLMVVFMFTYIIGVNADTGEMLWYVPHGTWNNNPNTPLYYNGMIMQITGDGWGTVMLRLIDGGKAVEEVWRNEADNQIGGAVRIGNYVFTTGHTNRGFFCFDWHTGEIRYREPTIAQGAIIYADGMLYLYCNRGTMNLIRPNPNRFDLVSSFEITMGEGPHLAHPVIHNGVLYIRHGCTIMAFNVKE